MNKDKEIQELLNDNWRFVEDGILPNTDTDVWLIVTMSNQPVLQQGYLNDLGVWSKGNDEPIEGLKQGVVGSVATVLAWQPILKPSPYVKKKEQKQ